MARPRKEGLEYFPLDVDMDQDDKIALIEAKHGLTGFSIIIKLFMKIYKNGYFYEWTEKEQLLFSSRVNVNINTIREIINDCINWDVFHEELFKKHHILTSKGIQERYTEAVARRKEVVLIGEYLLVRPELHIGNSRIRIRLVNLQREVVNADINPKNVDINSENADRNAQSKSKSKSESKSNNFKRKEEEDPNVIDLLLENKLITEDRINNTLREDIDDIMDNSGFDHPIEMIQEAIKDAARGNGRTWKFVYNKLNDWRKKGFKNPRDIGFPSGNSQENSLTALENFAQKRGHEIGGGNLGTE